MGMRGAPSLYLLKHIRRNVRLNFVLVCQGTAVKTTRNVLQDNPVFFLSTLTLLFNSITQYWHLALR